MFPIRIGLLLSIAANTYFLLTFLTKNYYLLHMAQESRSVRDTKSTKRIPCDDITPRFHHFPRGNYYILQNYFLAQKSFLCYNSITLATQGEWTDLGKLSTLVKRWRGPVSFAVYAPGRDFTDAVAHIQYLRECRRNKNSSRLIKDLVTFHLLFDLNHFAPGRIMVNQSVIPVNCSSLKGVTFKYTESVTTYKMAFGLEYPMNLARNVAKEGATTKYVLSADLGLYPSPSGKLIPDFLKMIGQSSNSNLSSRAKVFVLPEFEIDEDAKLPKGKHELLKTKKALAKPIPFPKAHEWLHAPVEGNLTVSYVEKLGDQIKVKDWKPIYIGIGTNQVPSHDERLPWDDVGQSDTLPQLYALCLLDFEFHVLDNAFLVRRPKEPETKVKGDSLEVIVKQEEVMAELEWLYGIREECKSMRPT